MISKSAKDERDKHIRRYAELLKERETVEAAKIQVKQSAAPEIGYKKPPPQKRGIASQIAAETQADCGPPIGPFFRPAAVSLVQLEA